MSLETNLLLLRDFRFAILYFVLGAGTIVALLIMVLC